MTRTNSLDNVTLRPCPFCGKIPKTIVSWDWEKLVYSYGIECDNQNCHVEVYVFDYSADTAVALWNEREGDK